MKTIADSSSIILLEKTKLLGKLVKKFNIIISKEVEREAIEKGKEKKYPDAYHIEEKIRNNLINVKEVKDQNKVNIIMKDFNIEKGESESIVLFSQEKANLLLTDDKLAFNACKSIDIPATGALALITESYNKKIINKEEAINMIKILAKEGRYKNQLIFQALQDIGWRENETNFNNYKYKDG
ncbi:hypothetical protein HYX16_05220 [Candidatus Woesearchaeota archaeon]|nr:hypothetical protein [Candidatus Woesearchaeota archaeon]